MKIPLARTLWTTPPRKERYGLKNPLVHNYNVQRVLCSCGQPGLKIIWPYCFYVCVFAALPYCTICQTAQLRVPFTAVDRYGLSNTVTFGVDSAATNCIDTSLGEYELPPDGCGGPCFCVEFRAPRTCGCLQGCGLAIDLRKYYSPTQVDTYRVGISFCDFPMTFKWPSNLAAYYDSAKLVYVRCCTVDCSDYQRFTVDMVAHDFVIIEDECVHGFQIYTWGPKNNVTAIGLERFILQRFALGQNYPNPFNPSTEITYAIAERSQVRLRVFDVLGREVAMLINETKEPGEYSCQWDASHISSGVYFYQLSTGHFTQTRMMTVIR